MPGNSCAKRSGELSLEPLSTTTISKSGRSMANKLRTHLAVISRLFQFKMAMTVRPVPDPLLSKRNIPATNRSKERGSRTHAETLSTSALCRLMDQVIIAMVFPLGQVVTFHSLYLCAMSGDKLLDLCPGDTIHLDRRQAHFLK